MAISVHLTLFVTGDAPRSRRARANLAEALTALGIASDVVTEVDILADPKAALDRGIFSTPALMIGSEANEASIMYGDLSEPAKLRRFLENISSGAMEDRPRA